MADEKPHGNLGYSARPAIPQADAMTIAYSYWVVAASVLTSLLLSGTMFAVFYRPGTFRALQKAKRQLTREQTALVATESLLLDANCQLSVLAIHDPLTGTHNRRYFDEVVQIEIKRAARTRSSISLLMIDVDHFQKLNDRHGQPAGDQALSAIAKALQATTLRAEDLVARYSGEEFAVLLPGAHPAGAFKIAELMRASVEQLRIQNEESPIGPFATVSIGIETRLPTVGESASAFVEAAGLALYRAKVQGRNRVEGALTSFAAYL